MSAFDGTSTYVESDVVPGLRNEAGLGSSRLASWVDQYRRRLLVTDIAVIVAVVFASQALRISRRTQVILEGIGSVNYWIVSFLLSAAWVVALGVNGAWDRKILGAGPSEYARVVRASFYLFGFVAIVSYLLQAEVARSYLAIALPLGMFGLLGCRWVWRQLLNEYRRAGTHMSAVLIIGGTSGATELAQRLKQNPAAGFHVAGLCIPAREAESDERGEFSGFPVIGDLSNIPAAVSQSRPHMVAVAASESFGSDEVRRLAWSLEGTGIALALAPSLTDVAGPRIHVRPVAGLPLMYVEEPRFKGPKLVVKTLTDFIGAVIGLVLLSPLLLVVGLAIKVHDRGPVFFRQERVGLSGKTFRVWKFRSMIPHADKRFSEVKQQAGQQNQVFYKSAADSRVTPIGRFLRKTSIDELPQLFNVLAGQMSIVGPRPLVPGEGAEVGNFLERRMLVKPGITGLWQVSGRSETTPEERIRLDFYYVENWSVAGDLVIIGRTVRTVLTRRGAY